MPLTVAEKDRRTLAAVIEALEAPGSNVDIPSWRDSQIVWDLRAREAYSYGRHFPLFRLLEAPGKRGRPARYVLNGERWGGGRGWNVSRTPDHQAAVRELTADANALILPFGALTGAGIDIDTIRALDVSPDQWVTLERTARTREEMPGIERDENYEVAREAATLQEVPDRYAWEWRLLTEEERLSADDVPTWQQRLPLLPGADGLYRWTEHRTRPVKPGPDGLYHWTESRHSLGESVFSAVREESETRAAKPFEAPSANARRTVFLHGRIGDVWREHCEDRPDGHEAGPSAACAHCGAELRATVVTRRRSVFLSGFDTNENPALYFLCELPRGAGRTVEQARDSLAPRAVHAALARGIEVRRQGDIFLVDTELTREQLEQRGATFARLTLWTRQAKPRAGEPGYVAPIPAAVRYRRARREAAYARKLWRESFADWSARALYSETLERERLQAREEMRLKEHPRRERKRSPISYLAPTTGANDRTRARGARERASDNLEKKSAALRSALFSGPNARWRMPTIAEQREQLVGRLESARADYDATLEHYRRELLSGERQRSRDAYRTRPGAHVALELWRRALDDARAKFRPETVFDTGAWRDRRERTRRACSIYGTAHTATEVARVGGTVYVRGTVSHVPELELGRGGIPDHRPIRLTADRWYLAVRNSVPRARRAT